MRLNAERARERQCDYNNEVLDRVLDRAKAVYLGLAIGDALGATTEFMTPDEIKAKYKVHKKIIGGGWLYLKPGQVTDDTEMSLALGKALLTTACWDIQGIADNLLAWMRNKPVDIGATCRRGIRDYMLKGQLEVPYNEWDAGNGAVMRMAPVALFTLGEAGLLEEYAIAQAHLTHNHILSDAACLAVGKLVHEGFWELIASGCTKLPVNWSQSTAVFVSTTTRAMPVPTWSIPCRRFFIISSALPVLRSAWSAWSTRAGMLIPRAPLPG